MTETFVTHADYDAIVAEISKLQDVNKDTADKVLAFVNSLRDLTFKLEPALKGESNDERELWQEYRELQQEKLVLLDLQHEWSYVEETVKGISESLHFLITDALEELAEHVNIIAETTRAHIDILEIYNTRRFEIIALVVTAVISYLAVWEFFVRDILTSIVFPNGLSPNLNYLLVLLTLLPVFVTVIWAWANRKKYS